MNYILQYRIIHRVVLCNDWLYNITIKESYKCSYCSEKDDIIHIDVTKPMNYGIPGPIGGRTLSNIDITNCNNIIELVFFWVTSNENL